MLFRIQPFIESFINESLIRYSTDLFKNTESLTNKTQRSYVCKDGSAVASFAAIFVYSSESKSEEITGNCVLNVSSLILTYCLLNSHIRAPP